MTYEMLEPNATYHWDQTSAVVKSNRDGGAVWIRRKGAPATVKPWAVGDLPEDKRRWYDLFQTAEGRKPQG